MLIQAFFLYLFSCVMNSYRKKKKAAEFCTYEIENTQVLRTVSVVQLSLESKLLEARITTRVTEWWCQCLRILVVLFI